MMFVTILSITMQKNLRSLRKRILPVLFLLVFAVSLSVGFIHPKPTEAATTYLTLAEWNDGQFVMKDFRTIDGTFAAGTPHVRTIRFIDQNPTDSEWGYKAVTNVPDLSYTECNGLAQIRIRSVHSDPRNYVIAPPDSIALQLNPKEHIVTAGTLGGLGPTSSYTLEIGDKWDAVFRLDYQISATSGCIAHDPLDGKNSYESGIDVGLDGGIGGHKIQVLPNILNEYGAHRLMFAYQDATHIRDLSQDGLTFTYEPSVTGSTDIYWGSKEAPGSKCADRLVTADGPTYSTRKIGRFYELIDDNNYKDIGSALDIGELHLDGNPQKCQIFRINHNKANLQYPPSYVIPEINPVPQPWTSTWFNATICQLNDPCQDVIASVDLALGKGLGSSKPDTACGWASWNPLHWIFCPFLDAVQTALDTFDGAIEQKLKLKTDFFNTSDCLQQTQETKPTACSLNAAWNRMLTYSLFILIIIGLIMVISQAASIGPFSAYSIRKIVPRIIIAVILITLSWPIMSFLVGLSNVAGQSMRALIYSPFDTLISNNPITIDPTAIIGALVVISVTTFGMGTLAVIALFGTALLAVAVGLATLYFREALLILLVITAPIGIVSMVLPNTQRFWKLWYSQLTSVLVVFPIFTGMVAIGSVFGAILWNQGNGDLVDQFAAFGAVYAPYFFLPRAFKMAGGAIGTFKNVASKAAAPGFSMLKNKRVSERQRIKQETATGTGRGAIRQSKFIRNAGVGVYGGARAGFGVGKRGKAHRETMVAAMGAAKQQEHAAELPDDDKATAATYRNEQEARIQGKAKIKAKLLASGVSDKDADTQAEQRANEAAKSISVSMGYGAATQIAGARALAASATGYLDKNDQIETLARVTEQTGGGTNLTNQLAAYSNSAGKQNGRADLVTSHPYTQGLIARQAGLTGEAAYSKQELALELADGGRMSNLEKTNAGMYVGGSNAGLETHMSYIAAEANRHMEDAMKYDQAALHMKDELDEKTLDGSINEDEKAEYKVNIRQAEDRRDSSVYQGKREIRELENIQRYATAYGTTGENSETIARYSKDSEAANVYLMQATEKDWAPAAKLADREKATKEAREAKAATLASTQPQTAVGMPTAVVPQTQPASQSTTQTGNTGGVVSDTEKDALAKLEAAKKAKAEYDRQYTPENSTARASTRVEREGLENDVQTAQADYDEVVKYRKGLESTAAASVAPTIPVAAAATQSQATPFPQPTAGTPAVAAPEAAPTPTASVAPASSASSASAPIATALGNMKTAITDLTQTLVNSNQSIAASSLPAKSDNTQPVAAPEGITGLSKGGEGTTEGEQPAKAPGNQLKYRPVIREGEYGPDGTGAPYTKVEAPTDYIEHSNRSGIPLSRLIDDQSLLRDRELTAAQKAAEIAKSAAAADPDKTKP